MHMCYKKNFVLHTKKSSNYVQGNVWYILYIQFIRGKKTECTKKEDDKNKFNTLRISRAFVRPTIS